MCSGRLYSRGPSGPSIQSHPAGTARTLVARRHTQASAGMILTMEVRHIRQKFLRCLQKRACPGQPAAHYPARDMPRGSRQMRIPTDSAGCDHLLRHDVGIGVRLAFRGANERNETRPPLLLPQAPFQETQPAHVIHLFRRQDAAA